MKRITGGAAIMLAAVLLELALVADLLEPSVGLALAGYAGLLAGAGLAIAGVLAGRRGR